MGRRVPGVNVNKRGMADSLTLDSLRLWNISALKDFCRRKGLIVKVRKDELVARVFAATEMKLPDIS